MSGKLLFVQLSVGIVLVGLLAAVIVLQFLSRNAYTDTLHANKSVSEQLVELGDELDILAAQDTPGYAQDLLTEIQRLKQSVSRINIPDYSYELQDINRSIRFLRTPSQASSPETKTTPDWKWTTMFPEGRELLLDCLRANYSQSPLLETTWIEGYLETVANTLDTGYAQDPASVMVFLINLGAAHDCWIITE